MRTRVLITTIALAALLATAATAQRSHRGPHGDIWQSLSADFDLDQNGEVTLDEFGGEGTFEHFDRNGDGVLTADDFAGRGRGMRMRRGPGGFMIVRVADGDRDGVITGGEWQDFLAALDANGDGLVQEDEIRALLSAAAGPGEKRMQNRRSGGPGPGGGPHAGGFLDRDEDGVLEIEDLEEIFANLDDDGDGDLTEGELPSFRPHGDMGPGMRRGLAGGMLLRFADADHDREVTSAEWQALVDSFDADGNGLIDGAEWAAAIPTPMGHEPPSEHFEMLLQLLDRDGDGVFEPADLAVIFDEIDSNGDGVVAGDELPHRRFRHRG